MYKTLLVAKGFSQIEGIDYSETFSPVVRYVTLRVLLAYAAIYDWEIDQMDAAFAILADCFCVVNDPVLARFRNELLNYP